MTELKGFCEPGFESIRDAFRENFDDGLEIGASVALFKDGKPVVDLWAGFKDPKHNEEWQEDTVIPVASTTKIMTNLCAVILVDQGKLDPEAPVVTYWPEFGKHGKDKVLVKHIFAHTSGIPGFDPPIPFSRVFSWEEMVKSLEDQTLWWEPGTMAGYESETFGFLAGELIRRCSSLTPGRYLQEHVCSKIDADFHIGFPHEEWHRMAMPIQDPESQLELGPIGEKAMNCFLNAWEDPEAFTTEIPGGNGVGNARSVAKIGAIYANHGEMCGHHFLSAPTLDFVLEEQDYSEDQVMGAMVRRGFGLGLSSPEFRCPGDKSLHWGGRGGSICLMDLASRTSLAYVPNRWIDVVMDDPRNAAIRQAYNLLFAS